METILQHAVTLSITLACPYSVAFDYLSHPPHQKEWAVHFFQDIREEDGQFIATLPFGEMPIRLDADRETGVLDIYLGDGAPTRTRLVEVGEGLCLYNFTLVQPPQMPDSVWEAEGIPNMEDELNRLKLLLEQKQH
ncbi:MAG TPA: hypothetical protein DCE41_26235 [Cytophagales bacterium]|nr:hypothetical protein [Cytophagales bacterium]HAA22417.1 hypothetical protein [Cytophagales bacterium]HAP65135.1 hypothetical protein [Cytophagales bacterium]